MLYPGSISLAVLLSDSLLAVVESARAGVGGERVRRRAQRRGGRRRLRRRGHLGRQDHT